MSSPTRKPLSKAFTSSRPYADLQRSARWNALSLEFQLPRRATARRLLVVYERIGCPNCSRIGSHSTRERGPAWRVPSGRIDSGAVAAQTERETRRPIKTISIGFRSRFRLHARGLQLAEEIIWHHDGPFADVSSVSSTRCRRWRENTSRLSCRRRRRRGLRGDVR